MTVTGILFLSFITVAAFLFLLARLMPWRIILRFAVPIDVLFSITALFAFGGTLGGTSVAITSGLILAVFLTVARLVSKHAGERFSYIRTKATKVKRTSRSWWIIRRGK